MNKCNYINYYYYFDDDKTTSNTRFPDSINMDFYENQSLGSMESFHVTTRENIPNKHWVCLVVDHESGYFDFSSASILVGVDNREYTKHIVIGKHKIPLDFQSDFYRDFDERVDLLKTNYLSFNVTKYITGNICQVTFNLITTDGLNKEILNISRTSKLVLE